MASADERVAVVACKAILDRAFGKPRDFQPEAESRPNESDVLARLEARFDRLRAAKAEEERLHAANEAEQ